jgi:phospholipase D1/2
MAHFLRQFKEELEERVGDVFNKDDSQEQVQVQEERPQDDPPPTQDETPAPESRVDTNHRYSSFAPQTTGHAKWYVDGASYFWAVSIALEGMTRSGRHRGLPLTLPGQRRERVSISWTGG